MDTTTTHVKSFGTAPVFLTAISTILGAILFLRFGYAVGTVGFVGVIGIIIIGHLVTIPTALALSEIATNQRVEGGGEYFIISRSFGLNIGATIGIALYFSQAISVAFYVIAFTEAFEPFFNFMHDKLGILLPRQVISIPSMILLSILILRRGANLGMKALYIVISILFLSLILFFLGKTDYALTNQVNLFHSSSGNLGTSFFVVFAICFPAFTGMTAGVGLSGDLKNPAKSIPFGTIAATIIGFIVYLFISWKLAISASPEDLVNNQLIMSKIAIFGPVIVPLGLAASTLSSALGSVMVAPRTLQALSIDKSFPLKRLNSFLAKGKGKTNEPYNASIITCLIAFVFVAMGSVDVVAQVISMFFMVTYGSISLISFLYHFGADPSYRPVFKSRWYISLVGFLMCLFLMFKMNPTYAIAAIILMGLIYTLVSHIHKDRGGMSSIFQAAVFQLSRHIQVFNQKAKKASVENKWRPSTVCVTDSSFDRDKAFRLMTWISDRYGFGTYIHLILDYYSKASSQYAREILSKLIDLSNGKSNVYIDTLISPSYTSAIAQVIQLPSISGMENNMILFEFDKDNPDNLKQIADNISLVKAGDLDICVLGSSRRNTVYKHGIHVWIRSHDFENSNLMILLSYIILAHHDWRKGKIKIFEICREQELDSTRQRLLDLIQTGRLPISPKNIEIIKIEENVNTKEHINSLSKEAALTVVGFREEQIRRDFDMFTGYEEIGDILFVNSNRQKNID